MEWEAIMQNTDVRYELPSAIKAYAGEINDLDSHECLPAGMWLDEFGSVMEPLRDACSKIEAMHEGREASTEVPKDDAPIDAHSVWQLKQQKAPGSFDLSRRPAVLDFTGVKRQVL